METIELCEKCGEGEAMYNLHPHNDKRTQKVCQECHTQAFWAEYIGARLNNDHLDDGRLVIRCEGSHYVIDEEAQTRYSRGHGGHKFVFELIAGPHKGKTITSTNVWSQGDIPDKFRDYLPDNARRIPQTYPSLLERIEKHELRTNS